MSEFLSSKCPLGRKVQEKPENSRTQNTSVFFHRFNKFGDGRFSCVCPVIDDEFRHNIVKVVVDPRGDSRVDVQTTLTML